MGSVVVYKYCLTILKMASGSILRNQESGRHYIGQLLWKPPVKSYKNVLKAKAILNKHQGKMSVKMNLF